MELAMKARIYHNPRCSKSRQTLDLLRERGIEPEIVEYLKTPPSKETLRALLGKLHIRAAQLIRSNEPEFKASGLSLDADDDALIDLMIEHPKLIERPIVEHGRRARLGRPPEQVLELFE
jgi:arsenate reductase (glutaredoxin)